MLNEPTLEKLMALRLNALATAWSEQQKDPESSSLCFDERFALSSTPSGWSARTSAWPTRCARPSCGSRGLHRGHRLPGAPPARQSARPRARHLRWIEEHHNVVITGPTGVGKTYVACALAQQACRKGYRALYRRVPRLFDELTLARADGSYPRLLARFARVDVLVLDDWGLAPLADQERRDLLEIIEDRHGHRSTIVTSQIPVKHWHDHLGDPTIADALCDRLIHNAHELVLQGPSRRKEAAQKN